MARNVSNNSCSLRLNLQNWFDIFLDIEIIYYGLMKKQISDECQHFECIVFIVASEKIKIIEVLSLRISFFSVNFVQ